MKHVLALLAVASIGIFGSAHASPAWTLTTHGTISSGTDYSGTFGGSPNAAFSLVGFEFTQSIIASVDPALWTNPDSDPYKLDLKWTGPEFTVAVTVQGTTVTITGPTSWGRQFLANGMTTGQSNWADQIYSDNESYDWRNDLEFTANAQIYSSKPLIPDLTFLQDLHIKVDENMHAASSFAWDNHFYLSGTPDTFVVSYNDKDVPEPGTLALVGLGLLGMAGLVRRRETQR